MKAASGSASEFKPSPVMISTLGSDMRERPLIRGLQVGDREVEDDDLETSYYGDDQIDLSELMREQFYLVLPMKPLCTEDCKGLCAQCGTNLNTGTCDCAPVWEDPRLAALKAIKGTSS